MFPSRHTTPNSELKDRVVTMADWLVQSVLWVGVMLSAVGLILLR